jgi:RHS repeat-associated protein
LNTRTTRSTDWLRKPPLTGGGVDEYFTRTDAAGRHTLLTDALGSALALVDADGTVQTQYTYEPFGEGAVTGAASPNPFQFTGRENDATGLYYYRARYYHPELKRFISEDPIAFAGGDLNLYVYAGNNPVTAADALGLWKPWAHEDITRTAIERVGGFRPHDANAIVAGNLAMDAWWTPVAWWNLFAVLSPRDASHSMPRSDPAGSNRIIQQRLRDAICHQQAGEHEAALHILGQGLHTAQDAWAHRYGPVRGGMKEHALARIGLSQDPDLPATNPIGFRRAVEESERILRDFQQGRGCKH